MDFGGGVASPVMWVVAAAARRELGNADADLVDTVTGQQTTGQTLVQPNAVGVGDPAALTDSQTSSLPLNADGTRVLVTTLDGDSSTGFTTRAVVTDAAGAPIGQPLTLSGAPGTALVSADGSHVLVTAVAYDSATGSTTSVAVLDINTGAQTGTTFVLAGDDTGSPPQLLNADGTRALITTAVNDSRTSTWATWSTVIDFTTDTQIGTTVKVDGSPSGSPLVTADRTRAVITTFVDDWSTRSTSTRVAVIDTTTGKQTGTTLTLVGRPSGSQLSGAGGSTAQVATTAGLVATIDTSTGSSLTIPVKYPWGFDVDAFLYTPIGQIVGGIVVSAYFVGSAFLTFVVVGPVIAVYDWVATTLGLPTFGQWQLAQAGLSTT
jgi:hypothetical protein